MGFEVSGYIKIGDLARMMGTTVRTLHYYDEIGLLKPAEVSKSGHRQYDINSMTEIYQIVAMKEMGFNLDQIKKLLRSENIDVLSLVKLQISNVQDEIAQKHLLFSKLLKLNQKLTGDRNVSSEDFQSIVPFISSSADNYFTKEQIEKLKEQLESDHSAKDTSLKWFDFIAKLTYCHKNDFSKSDKLAKDCVDYWSQLTSDLIEKDEQIKESVFAFHASETNTQLRFGLTDELFSYLMNLME